MLPRGAGRELAAPTSACFVTAAALLDRLHSLPADVDALVMADYGEHGREGAREMLGIPVVDITEASAMLALYLAPQFGVITTLPRACSQIRDSLHTAGLMDRCAAIEAANIPVLDLDGDLAGALEALCDAGHRAVAAGAEVLALGCAGMAGLADSVQDKLAVPVIDSVTAGVALAESLIHLRLTTSKALSYAAPRHKHRAGWPLTPEELS